MASQNYTKFEDQSQIRNADYPVIPLEERSNAASTSNAYSGPQVPLEPVIPAVTFQPQPFTPNVLDPVSRQMYDSLSTKHMSSNALLNSLSEGGTRLNSAVNAQFTSLKDGMSYSDMLNGLLYKGERVVNYNQFQYLQYSNIVLSDEANNPVTQKPGGICLLTDKRILLMSCQMNQTNSLKMFGDPKKMPGGYTVETCLVDSTCYLPIPYRFLKSVEMNGQSGIAGNIHINPQPPCCCGICGGCGLLCGIPSMLKQWTSSRVTIVESNQMVITIGVLMPPWGRRMFLNIHVTTNVPVTIVRDYVSLLQQYATELN